MIFQLDKLLKKKLPGEDLVSQNITQRAVNIPPFGDQSRIKFCLLMTLEISINYSSFDNER